MSFKNVILFLFAVTIAACVTAPYKRFAQVKVGMYRGEVLDIAGSPQESRFKDDEYIWIYHFIENEQLIAKEVRITKEFVTYVGDPLAPSIEKILKVQVGQGKSEVLDILGFPKKTTVQNSQEFWFYATHEASGTPTHMVTFTEDKVTAVGPATGFPKLKDKTSDGEKGYVPLE
jgi:outer membrane protein assembly factor BamE (lipoprotein component of BamABCDE complex)